MTTQEITNRLTEADKQFLEQLAVCTEMQCSTFKEGIRIEDFKDYYKAKDIDQTFKKLLVLDLVEDTESHYIPFYSEKQEVSESTTIRLTARAKALPFISSIAKAV